MEEHRWEAIRWMNDDRDRDWDQRLRPRLRPSEIRPSGARPQGMRQWVDRHNEELYPKWPLRYTDSELRGQRRELCDSEICDLLASYAIPRATNTLGRDLGQYLKAQEKAKDSKTFLLGTRAEIARRKGCAFCRLATAAIENSERGRNSRLDTIIYVFSRMDTDIHLELVDDRERSILGLGQRIVLCDPTGESSERSVRLVSAKTVPLLNIQRWIKKCEKYHGESCGKLYDRPQSRQEAYKNIRLIDVVRDCIVQLPWTIDVRYLALSYAWGPTSQESKQLLDASNVGKLSERGGLTNHLTLPKTFSDAMKLTKSLGEKYLWIDSLCLAKDIDDFQSGIKAMDFVYEFANATIVAACGYGADSGLPGVGEERHWTEQHAETIKAGLKLILHSALPCRLSRSFWASRGWT